MTGGSRYPSIQWRMLAALLISTGSFVGATYLWMDSVDLVPGHDLIAYALVSAPEIPYWRLSYTLLYGSNQRLATTDTAGVLTPKAVTLEQLHVSRNTFREWLRTKVYDGMSLQRVIWLPIAVSVVVLLILVGVAGLLEHGAHDVIRGPRILSKREFWRMNTFKRKGFYIETR